MIVWGSTDIDEDLEYYDPEPHRHDVPEDVEDTEADAFWLEDEEVWS